MSQGIGPGEILYPGWMGPRIAAAGTLPLPQPAINQNVLMGDYSTSSTTSVTIGNGFGTSIVAGPSGIIEWKCEPLLSSDTLGDAAVVESFFNTTGIPAQGAPPTGTGLAATFTDGPQITQNTIISFEKGLVPGTLYYFYGTLRCSAGSATISDGSLYLLFTW